MNPEQGLQIQDLAGMLRRRRGVVAVLAGAVFLASIVVAAVLPNVYQAWTTVLVEPQTVSTRLVEAGLEGSQLENRLHLMTMQILSRGRLSKIITELDLYPEESKEMTREEVISLMRSQIRVEPVLPELEVTDRKRQPDFEINTFRLYFRSESASTAAAVANRLANDFIDEHLRERVQVSGDTSEFIEAELDRLSTRIAEVEARIAAVKDENPGSLPEDMAANQRLMERAMDSLRQAQGDYATAKSDEAFYKQQALSGGLVVSQQLTPERKLESLELLLAEYRGRGFTEKHPDVVSTEQEIAAVKAQIEAAASLGDDVDREAPASLAQQNAKAEEQRAALRAAAAGEDIQRINAQISEIQQHLAETPRVAEQLAALEREYQHLFGSYQEFSNKRLEAGVAANMERRQKGEQFRILESAFPPPQPISPNRLLIVVVGLLLGVALGSGVALLLEVLDSSFHGARQLQMSLRLPVLASIPGIVLESDRAAMRRRRIRNAVAAVAITCVVLAGAVAGNWAVNGVPGFVDTIIQGEGAETPAPAAGEQG